MKIKKASIKGLHKKSESPLPDIEYGRWKDKCTKLRKKLIKDRKKEENE